jgi:hypothetical protein
MERKTEIIDLLKARWSEGMHISWVRLVPVDDERYNLQIHFMGMVPLGEGGDLPYHTVTIDREKIPDGVTVKGWEGWPDEIVDLALMSDSEAETIIRAIAIEGCALDYCGSLPFPDGTRHTWVTKPNRWQTLRAMPKPGDSN